MSDPMDLLKPNAFLIDHETIVLGADTRRPKGSHHMVVMSAEEALSVAHEIVTLRKFRDVVKDAAKKRREGQDA